MKRNILSMVAGACQRVLEKDPVSKKRLEPIMGKRLLMHVTDHSLCVLCKMTSHGLSLSLATLTDGAEVVLRGDTVAWLRCATWGRPGLPPGMVLEGEMAVAQVWQDVARHIEIDWPAFLAPLVGDSIAQLMADTGTDAAAHVSDVAKDRVQDAVDYAQEETLSLPTKYEAQVFYEDIDKLRDDVARCKARIKRLSEARGIPMPDETHVHVNIKLKADINIHARVSSGPSPSPEVGA